MPHIHHLYDFVVAPYIVNKDRVLLVNHPRYGLWIAPGGHIELNENPLEALHREIKEETGLDVTLMAHTAPVQFDGFTSLPTPNYLDVHNANLPHQHISLTYFCRSERDNFIKSDEHTDMRWVDLDELNNPELNLSDAVKFYAKKAIALAKNFKK